MGLGYIVIGQEEIPCKHYIKWSISRAMACRAGSDRYCIRTLTKGLVPHEASDFVHYNSSLTGGDWTDIRLCIDFDITAYDTDQLLIPLTHPQFPDPLARSMSRIRSRTFRRYTLDQRGHPRTPQLR
jgi:hypothetical protein